MFSSDLFTDINSIALTGGEPLLRTDIAEIIQKIHDITGVKPGITTNGLMPARLASVLESTHKIIDCVGFSIDGTKASHDAVRGIDGAYEKVNESLNIAKKFGVKISVNMTMFNKNYMDLQQTFEKYKNDNFSYKLAQTSKFYYGDNSDLDITLSDDAKKQILGWLDSLGQKNLYDFFLSDWILYGKRPLPCYAGRFEMYLNAVGDVCPCIHKPRFGNIRENKIDKIWLSDQAQNLRKQYKSCSECYERCTVSTFEIDFLKWRALKFICGFESKHK